MIFSKAATLSAALVSVAKALATNVNSENYSTLEVDAAPDFVRPYVLRHYANSHAVSIGAQVYRFQVTGPSSDYAFTLMSTNAPESGYLGVLPHIHEHHYENFFNYRGRFQLWAEKNGEENARSLTSGDYGAVPPNITHTFQILDPDTEMVGVIVPGGFEDLFYALGSNFSSGTYTPYVPNVADSGIAGPDSAEISALESFDVYADLDYEPRRDLVNGSAPSGSIWHTGNNTLADNATTPYFVANSRGPIYLNSEHGYQIVQPLVTPEQSPEGNFTMATISIDEHFAYANETIATWNLPGSAAFEVLEGQLTIALEGYPTYALLDGDVVFIPGNTSYQYWSLVAFTKVLYVSSGSSGLDTQLRVGGELWRDSVFPTY